MDTKDFPAVIAAKEIVKEHMKFYNKMMGKKPKAVSNPDFDMTEHLLYLFQEWKEDHLSQTQYITLVEAAKELYGKN